jgi:hypothetical protein
VHTNIKCPSRAHARKEPTTVKASQAPLLNAPFKFNTAENGNENISMAIFV